MPPETALQVLQSGEWLWDLGQLNTDTRRLLARMCRKGEVEKARALWPYIWAGTCQKTIYRLTPACSR